MLQSLALQPHALPALNLCFLLLMPCVLPQQ
jgi:hypothetical protein